MKLTIPQKLKKGDVIGFISPSAGLAGLFPHRVEQAKKTLEKFGYRVKFAPNALTRKGYVSATPMERADDIHRMFLDREVKAIICTIGGNHSNQLLKYLDFEIVKQNPKLFIGYSDITVLHYAFAKKSNLQTFYGPCVIPEFGEYPDVLPYTLEYFLKAVAHDGPIRTVVPSETWTDEFLDWGKKKDLERPRKLYSSTGYTWWKKGNARGNIFGGTIPSINHLAGTAYWVDLSKKILFLDIPEGSDPGTGFPLSEFDSFLADLDNLEVFQKIAGLIIGRPYQFSERDTNSLREIVLYYTKGQKYPILFNANIGHASPIITVPLGAEANLSSDENKFEILGGGEI